MKRTLFTVMIALAILTGAYSIAGAVDGPHADYRPDVSDTSNTGRYYGGCSSGAACHLTRNTFLPADLGTGGSADMTNYCLTCHNTSGEAHNKSAGSPSNNLYHGSTTIQIGNAGDSHSWNGKNLNAGTRTPTATGFNGTVKMPGTDHRVTCQTCHSAMTKVTTPVTQNIENWVSATLQSGNSYTISGYPNTSQYLAKYIKVYRSSSPVLARPTNTRYINLTYLVDPSEYTYNPLSATITFNTSQAGKYIYVEIPQPYMRVDNTANAICFDCHNDRLSRSVSHEPGTGAKNGHPVNVTYGNRSGLNNTLKSSATGNAYLEDGKVLCTSCHDPHNAASKNGQIMRESDDQRLCGDCHKTRLDGFTTAGSVNIHNGAKHLTPTVCIDCHGTHNDNNIMLIKNVINGKTITFRTFSGDNSFGNQNGTSVCEACHAATTYHKSDNTGTTHHTSDNCLKCHSHASGFQATGCTTCHGMPPAAGSVPTSYGWPGDGDKHANHMGYILTKFGLSGQAACGTCHGTKPGTPHPENLDTAYIDTSSPIYWNGGTWSNGGTTGKVSTADDSCANVACHSTTGSRNWSGPSILSCDTCHPYPGSATNDWPAGNGHSVRADGATYIHLPATGYNAATDDYTTMVNDPTRCGKCHVYDPNHKSNTVTLQGNGNAACGGGNFTINVTTSGSNVTCSNVRCHASNRSTPNWW